MPLKTEMSARLFRMDNGDIFFSDFGIGRNLSNDWRAQEAVFNRLAERLSNDQESLSLLAETRELLAAERSVYDPPPPITGPTKDLREMSDLEVEEAVMRGEFRS